MNDFTVLVVDDDFHIAALHSRLVAEAPRFTPVATVGTVRGALSLIETHHPDLVLLDSYLPDGSGLDLIRHIEPDVIAITAANDAATVRRAVRSGAFGYLVKPFEPQLLAAKLASFAAFADTVRPARALDQTSIDGVFRMLGPDLRARARTATEQAILGCVSATEQLSAPDIAERIGVSRATAQRYLGSLAAENLLTVTLRYGATGRPEHRYTLTPAR